MTFILLEENGKPHHDFGERLLCLKTSSGHCENESVEEGLLHTFLQYSSQMACPRRFKVTLVAFIYLFATVYFQIFNLSDFSPLCDIKCLFKWSASEDAKSHWLHLFDLSPLCFLKCVFKTSPREEAKSHWLHLFDFSPL